MLRPHRQRSTQHRRASEGRPLHTRRTNHIRLCLPDLPRPERGALMGALDVILWYFIAWLALFGLIRAIL